MPESSDPSPCPTCGSTSATGGLGGFSGMCPGCLLGMVLDEEEGDAAGPQAGDRIGRYCLVEEIGSGGMGTVWKARQEEPVQREVALKIIKLGMDTREIVSRFEAERQTLAAMDHPNIAWVLDAGSTAEGRPYFVMELIAGEPLTDFCANRRSSLPERLELFLKLCEAVQHAHRKGVIHRDLKPSNVLVASGSEDILKVIDFGIAKAIDGGGRGHESLLTRTTHRVGTPAWMSPEQLAGEGIDTRTDVYGLGILLYQLLAGQLPFPEGDERHDRLPPRPSSRMEPGPESGLSPTAVAGDLDRIVLKALAPEPDRRYGSPSELAGDIGRHLRHEPVEARAPSAGYLLSRFVRRHAVAAVGITGIVLALLVGLVTSSILYSREVRARRALSVEAEKSTMVSAFLTDLLSSAGVSKSLGRDATMLKEVLDEAATRIRNAPALPAEVELELRAVIGRTYMDLDEYPRAIQEFEKGLALWATRPVREDREKAVLTLDLAEAWEKEGDSGKAEPLVREAIALVENLQPVDEALLHEAQSLLAWIFLKTGRASLGEDLARSAYQAWTEDPSLEYLEEAPKTYAMILRQAGEHRKAAAVLREELDHLRATCPSPHPLLANCLDNYGMTLLASGETALAEEILREALAEGRMVHGDRSPHEDHVLTHLARIEKLRGNDVRERELLQQAVAVSRRVYSPGHRYRREPIAALQSALLRQAEEAWQRGKRRSAEERLREVRELAAQSEARADLVLDRKRLSRLRESLQSPE